MISKTCMKQIYPLASHTKTKEYIKIKKEENRLFQFAQLHCSPFSLLLHLPFLS